MISLQLSNLGSSANKRWESYTLDPTGSEMGEFVATIFETDKIKFVLTCPSDTKSASIFIGDAEIKGSLEEQSGDKNRFVFMPKYNARFGYEAICLHYCGIANFSAIINREHSSDPDRFLFESVNVCGRKVTAERIKNILEFLSNNITEDLLVALSPTQLSANLVNNGVSMAERIQRLEHSLKDINGTVQSITHRPIKYLRPTSRIIHNPTPDKMSGADMEWVLENAGQAVEAENPDEGLFHYGFKWRSLPEIQSESASDSTGVEENLIIRYYLLSLRTAAAEMVSESRTHKPGKASSHDLSMGDEGTGYYNFYSIAAKLLGTLGSGYYHRAMACLDNCNSLLSQFDAKVSTSKRRPSSLKPTAKMHANIHYIRMARLMNDWLQKKEVVWLDKILFSSINSTWRLFEYYTVISTHKWLLSRAENTNTGLFKGVIGSEKVTLFYEPRIPTANKAMPENNYVVIDRFTKNLRTPDIVIELESHNQRQLLVFDAKCRREADVWSDLRICESKYTNSIRDRITGKPIVKSLVMLYPKTSQHSDTRFQDYYLEPHRKDDAIYVEPVMGIQRVSIEKNGIEQSYSELLTTLLDKFSRHDDKPIVKRLLKLAV